MEMTDRNLHLPIVESRFCDAAAAGALRMLARNVPFLA
jgi:hypothetical protein